MDGVLGVLHLLSVLEMIPGVLNSKILINNPNYVLAAFKVSTKIR